MQNWPQILKGKKILFPLFVWLSAHVTGPECEPRPLAMQSLPRPPPPQPIHDGMHGEMARLGNQFVVMQGKFEAVSRNFSYNKNNFPLLLYYTRGGTVYKMFNLSVITDMINKINL